MIMMITKLIITERRREVVNSSIVIATIFSNTAIKVEIAAKSIKRKKVPPQNAPFDILENTETKVTKITLV